MGAGARGTVGGCSTRHRFSQAAAAAAAAPGTCAAEGAGQNGCQTPCDTSFCGKTCLHSTQGSWGDKARHSEDERCTARGAE